ncbi:pentapeptide repeat-containing protein [Clostridium sp. CTA-19]
MEFLDNDYYRKKFSNIKESKFLIEKNFEQCEFLNCDFLQGDFSCSTFEDCIFKECNLALINVDDTKFRNVTFEGCKIVGINFTKCDNFILDVKFFESLINSCNFSRLSLKKTSFKGSIIKECDFIEVNLQECDFTYTTLTKSVFLDCNLSKADFSYAKEYDINPQANKLKKAIFTVPDAAMLLKYFDIVIK